MEKNEHLTYFKVKNFKRFEEFELNDITQFNIIVGDNNVGKTTLLEALLFSEDINQQLHNLLGCFSFKFSREYTKTLTSSELINNVLPVYYKDKNKREHVFESLKNEKHTDIIKIKIDSFENLSDKNKKLLINKGGQTKGSIIIITKNDKVKDIKSEENLITPENTYLNYIPFSLAYNDDLIGFYSKFIQQDKERKNRFVDSLKSFIPNIESVEITTRFLKHPVIEVFEKTSNEPKLLSTYGDGANKLFRILAEIIASRGKRLMIDEIDTGIHYSRFEEFWKTILKTAKEYDVQLYATTHNPDCLNYLVDALENDDMKSYQKDTSVFALEELPDKSVKSFKHDFKGFSFLVKKGIEIRGGKNE
ncbi:MAG: AAA family ATPase [Bacteroidales bacterium]|nr:AAA family ATPase [Bacteroidales bacterium]